MSNPKSQDDWDDLVDELLNNSELGIGDLEYLQAVDDREYGACISATQKERIRVIRDAADGKG